MTISTKIEGEVLTIVFNDELSIYTANTFRDLLVEQLGEIKKIIVDLSQVTDIDSSGLQFLLAIKNLRSEKEIEFIHHSSAVLEVIELCGLAGKFDDAIVISAEGSA